MEARFEPEQVVQSAVGENATQVHLRVARADAVDAPVTLHQAHRVPRQVVVDDVACLLQVHALGQHIGGNHNVVQVAVVPGWRIGGAGSEAPQHRVPIA